MGKSSQEQVPKILREQPSVASNRSTDQASGQPPPFNGGSEDARTNIDQTGTAGIDSIQGGTTDTPATSDNVTQSSDVDAGTAPSSGSDVRKIDATHAKKVDEQKPRPSSTDPTEINSDNNGPVFDGDTAG